MNKKIHHLLAAVALCAGLHQAAAQVVLNPNQIQGTLKFANSNPAVLQILNAPGNLGIESGVVFASSLAPETGYSEEGVFNLTSPSNSAPYQATVESGNPGIAYVLSPQVDIASNNEVYYFNPSNSAPVVSGASPVTVNFNESVTILNLVFVNSVGTPVPVNVGLIKAVLPGSGGIQAENDLGNNTFISGPGVTNWYFIVRGGTNYALSVPYDIGTNIYSTQVQYQFNTNITTVADQVMTITCVVPGAANTGQIAGNVAITGEFLLSVPGTPPYPSRTVVEANYGPNNNQRWCTVPGTNFTASASGAFALTNLPLSSSSSPAQGYEVHAEMMFGTNSQYSYFSTPYLGVGLNPAVTVTAASSGYIGNMFVITPGYVDGTVLLQGPPENGTTNSLLRGLVNAYQQDPGPNGIPGSVDIYGIYGSYLYFAGVDALAPGATLAAVYGESDRSLAGAFNPASSAFQGSYEAVVGGLSSQNSLWNINGLELSMFNESYFSPATYYDEPILEITDNRTNTASVEIAAGQHYTNNINYGLSEVQIGFTSTSGSFYEPEVFEGFGSFTNLDFQGNAANYNVFVEEASGTPVYAADATNHGVVNLLLPQGTYTLNPEVTTVNPTNGDENFIYLAPISLTVGSQQTISLSECLQINVGLPAFTSNSILPVVGSVSSCTNVTLITYSLNGGSPVTVCTGCGINPGFNFNLNLAAAGACVTNTVVITAYDSNGESSSVTAQIQFNNVPPTITCPGNITISCAESNQVPVTFSPTASAYCGGPVTVICTPPSGSLFPAGTNIVACYAVDAFGNQSPPCNFEVIVQSQMPSIQAAVIVTWGCGILQSAPTPTGPWTNVPGATSPYSAAVTRPETYYRTQQ